MDWRITSILKVYGLSMRKHPILTYRRLRDVLEYDRQTGIFKWLVDRGRKAHKDQAAGAVDSHGHLVIGIDGRIYQASRLAWFYCTNDWPNGRITYFNKNKTDLRFANLVLMSDTVVGVTLRAKYQRAMRELNTMIDEAIQNDTALYQEYVHSDLGRMRKIRSIVRHKLRTDYSLPKIYLGAPKK